MGRCAGDDGSAFTMYEPSELYTGDIPLMTRRKDCGALAWLLDSLISWSEANPLVHAAICSEGCVIDPVWHVMRRPLAYYRKTGWRLRPNCSTEERQAAARWAQSRIGDPYGVAELLDDGVRLDLHFVARAWYRMHRRRYTCSGFVAEAYARAGVVLTRAPLPSPADLAYSPVLTGRRPWDPKVRSARAAEKRGRAARGDASRESPRRRAAH